MFMVHPPLVLSAKHRLFVRKYLSTEESKTPVVSSPVFRKTERIAIASLYTPHYDMSNEANCTVRVCHFATIGKQVTISARAQVQTPSGAMLTYAIDSATMEFLQFLNLSDLGGKELPSTCIFYGNKGLEAQLGKRIIRATSGSMREGGHSLGIILLPAQTVQADTASITGTLALVFQPNSTLYAAIHDDEGREFELRMGQANQILLGKSIQADDALQSVIGQANRLFSQFVEKISSYWNSKAVSAVNSTQPAVLYEQVIWKSRLDA